MNAAAERDDRSSPAMSWPNAVFRFGLEIAMLIGLGYGAYNLSDTTLVRLPLAFLIPAAAAVAWAVFRAPGDQSAGKQGIVPIAGWQRLMLELGLFLAAIAGTWAAGSPTAALLLLAATLLHYLLTWRRTRWLLSGAS
jgi:hypothetical protein